MEEIVVIGAGLYGLYGALKISEIKKDAKIWVLEIDPEPFSRATYINQARVHMGYHYPRSLSTAVKSAHYFDRFNENYAFCVNKNFTQIYSTSANFSWTNEKEFIKFCLNAGIECDPVSPDLYFKKGTCDGAFITKEYTFDAQILRDYFLERIKANPNIQIKFNTEIDTIERVNGTTTDEKVYSIQTKDGWTVETRFILNASYAGVNTILDKLKLPLFKIKYELCEIILCNVSKELRDIGITVMDGPFFSIMPFGKTGYHSLTSVTFTPHVTSYNDLPVFECQQRCEPRYCSKTKLGNCNHCQAKPKSSWEFMSALAKKYLKDKYQFEYVKSLFAIKPILMASEIDDSRPTVIKTLERNPTFVSVLSGKINTVFDLDEVLEDEFKQR